MLVKDVEGDEVWQITIAPPVQVGLLLNCACMYVNEWQASLDVLSLHVREGI